MSSTRSESVAVRSTQRPWSPAPIRLAPLEAPVPVIAPYGHDRLSAALSDSGSSYDAVPVEEYQQRLTRYDFETNNGSFCRHNDTLDEPNDVFPLYQHASLYHPNAVEPPQHMYYPYVDDRPSNNSSWSRNDSPKPRYVDRSQPWDSNSSPSFARPTRTASPDSRLSFSSYEPSFAPPRAGSARSLSNHHSRPSVAHVASFGQAWTPAVVADDRGTPSVIDPYHTSPNYNAYPSNNARMGASDAALSSPSAVEYPEWLTPLSSLAPSYHSNSASGPYISPALKAERIRMLEAEFATTNAGPKDGHSRVTDLGITRGTVLFRAEGRNFRIIVRTIQLLLAWISACTAVYTALVIHPKPAPAASSAPLTFVFYALAILSALLTFYYSFLRRYAPMRRLFGAMAQCCRRRSKHSSKVRQRGGRPMRGGRRRGERPPGGGRKSEKSRDSDSDDEHIQERQPLQVNLVLDPRYFGTQGGTPGAFDGNPIRSPTPSSGITSLLTRGGEPLSLLSPTSPRSGVPTTATIHTLSTTALASTSPHNRRLQKRTAAANRRTLTRLLFLDAFLALGWGTIFVLLLLPSSKSSTCTPGAFAGWCNGYNIVRAAGCVLSLSSLVAFVLDAMDVRALGTEAKRRQQEAMSDVTV